MKKLSLVFACLLISMLGWGQQSPYGTGLIQQPNAASARNYLGIVQGGGTNSGTVTNFTSGNLSPLFTTAVGTPTSAPSLTFAQISQNQKLFFASPNASAGVPTFRSIVSSDIPALAYVTSVGLSLPGSVFSVSGSPVTGAGTLTGNFQTQTPNTVFAGPPSGGALAPTFRALVDADIPRTGFTNHSDVVPTTLQPGDIIAYDGIGFWTNGPQQSATGSGTVTSFSAGNLSPLFTSSVLNPTTTPALSFAQVSQNANLFFASPDGVSGNPSFRAIVAADVPRDVFTNHSDVVTTTLQPGNIVAYNGAGAWTNGPPTIPRDVFTNHVDVVTTTLQPGDVIAYNGAGSWTNGPPSTNGVGSATSLPGLLVRPVQASAAGVLSAPTWPDMTTYYFDEEFDSWIGNTAGQFGKNRWNVSALGGGGTVINASSNSPPHFGVIELQSPTTAGNVFLVSSYGSTGILPYGQLKTTPNWMIRGTFLLSVTNAGSVFRIGLIDSGYQAQLTANFPSNCLWIRWDKRTSDGEFFSFEARKDATIETNASTIRVIANTWYSFTLLSTNAGTVMCQINNETPVSMVNISDTAMCLAAITEGATTASRLWIDRISFMASSMSR